MAIPSKLYVVNFGDREYLVRALTQRGAASGLVEYLARQSAANARLASQDDVLEMAGRGVKPIDVVASEPASESAEGAGLPA